MMILSTIRVRNKYIHNGKYNVDGFQNSLSHLSLSLAILCRVHLLIFVFYLGDQLR